MIDPELFEIRPLNYSNSAAFIFKHHYTKNMAQGASLALGLFYKKKYFVAVCVFSSPSSEKARAWPFGEEEKHRVIELHRLAMIKKDNWKSRPRNILSWFVSRCLKLIVQHKPDIRCIITFADSTEGHKGTIYRALNEALIELRYSQRITIIKSCQLKLTVKTLVELKLNRKD